MIHLAERDAYDGAVSRLADFCRPRQFCLPSLKSGAVQLEYGILAEPVLGVPMIVSYTDKAKEAGEQYVLLKRAAKQLEEVLGQSLGLVNARWDRTEDENGRSLYVLRLKDPFGEVSGDFAPAELQSPNQMYFRLYRLWGDLLRVQTNQQLQALAGN